MSDADPSELLALCKRRGFIWPSFEIYGGVAGMFDYGPLGCALRNNIVDVWRAIYKGREGFVEIDSETVNPREVFKASGHVDEFSDLITYCKACGSPFRADHLVKGFYDNPDVLFIFIAHEDKGQPKGNMAKNIRYDADIKIRVEGYKAFATTRYEDSEKGEGGADFIIWEQGAREYWADVLKHSNLRQWQRTRQWTAYTGDF